MVGGKEITVVDLETHHSIKRRGRWLSREKNSGDN